MDLRQPMFFQLSCDHLMIGGIFHFGEWDPAAVRRFAKRKGYAAEDFADLPPILEGTDGYNWRPDGSGHSLVWLPCIPEDRHYQKILVHEIVHLVQNGMEFIGSDCQETQAHLTAWFWCEAMKKVDKKAVSPQRRRHT